MADLTTPAAAAAFGSAITVAGVATGIPPDLVLPGAAGAMYAVLRTDEGRAWGRVVQVVVGTLFATWCALPLSIVAADVMPILGKVPQDMLRYPLALVLGWGGLRALTLRGGAILKGGKP